MYVKSLCYVRMLGRVSNVTGGTERERSMRKVNHEVMGQNVYQLVQRVQMTDRERQVAVGAIRIAEGFANAVLWVKEKVAAMGPWFLKPSVKH